MTGCCIICSRPIRSNKTSLCPLCFRELRRQRLAYVCNHRCCVCGFPLFEGDDQCIFHGEHELYTIRLHFYRGLMHELIGRYKFNGIRRLSFLLAAQINLELKKLDTEDMLLVPVPCSRRSFKQRGWDHMQLVGRRLSGYYGYRVADLLIRPGGRRMQKAGSRSDRIAFREAGYRVKRSAERAAGGRQIIVIDDIMTTGSTIRSAASALQDFTPKEIMALVLAMD